jgi:hypothetical protein
MDDIRCMLMAIPFCGSVEASEFWKLTDLKTTIDRGRTDEEPGSKPGDQTPAERANPHSGVHTYITDCVEQAHQTSLTEW